MCDIEESNCTFDEFEESTIKALAQSFGLSVDCLRTPYSGVCSSLRVTITALNESSNLLRPTF